MSNPKRVRDLYSTEGCSDVGGFNWIYIGYTWMHTFRNTYR